MANNKHCKNSAQWFENRIDPMARTQGERERVQQEENIHWTRPPNWFSSIFQPPPQLFGTEE